MAAHATSTPAPGADDRSRIERSIEHHLDRAGALIALLDGADGDPDREDDEREEDGDGQDAAWAERADQRGLYPLEPAGVTVRRIARALAGRAAR